MSTNYPMTFDDFCDRLYKYQKGVGGEATNAEFKHGMNGEPILGDCLGVNPRDEEAATLLTLLSGAEIMEDWFTSFIKSHGKQGYFAVNVGMDDNKNFDDDMLITVCDTTVTPEGYVSHRLTEQDFMWIGMQFIHAALMHNIERRKQGTQ